MADAGVKAGRRKLMIAPRCVERLPRVSEKNKACDMKRAKVRISAPSKNILKEMAGIVSKQVNAGNLLRKPAGE